MKMDTQIILLLFFGLAVDAAHILKEPDVNPCIQEYQEPTRRFTNGHGFQYLYRRRPLEFVSTPAAVQSTTKVMVPSTEAVQSTTKVKVTTPAVAQSTTKVMVPAVSTSKPKTDKVTAIKNRRNNMFDAMRERYHSNKNKKSNSSDDRQKREINYKTIPEAPILPKLDIQALPEYVQKMLASNPISENRNEIVHREQNNDNLQDEMEKLFSDDTEIDKKPRTYGMKLNNGQGYSWNLINEQIKNTHDDTQHISKPAQEFTESQQANITHEKTKQENISNIEKETKPQPSLRLLATTEAEIINKQKLKKLEDNDLQDKAILIVKEPKDHDKPNSNIKDRFNEMFANINKSLNPPENGKLRTYGMSLKGGSANIWNEIAGAPNIIIQTTSVTPIIKENEENKTSIIIKDITEPSYDLSVDQNNADLLEGIGHTEERTNNKTPILDENQIAHLTTPEPELSFKTTLGSIQKVKRFTEENAINSKQNTDLRDKMENSFKLILEKFPPFQAITNKPNTTTEVEKQDKEPKTYGMNLTGNHGYVWNELTNPEIRYNVGEKDASNTTDQIDTKPTTSPSTIENESENSSQPSTKITAPVTEIPTTSKVTSNEKDVTTTISPVTTEVTSASTTTESKPQTTEITRESTTTETNPETTEIVSVSTTESNPLTTKIASEYTTTETNPQTTKITSESTTESNPQTTEITNESITTETDPQTTEITSESTTTESNPQTTEEQPQTTEPETTETSSATTEQNDKDDKIENTNQEEDNNDKNPVQISLDELLKKDEFLDWLSKWTSTYIEVFNKYIEKMVKDEVAKQLKNYMNDKDSVNNEENNNNGVLENKANNTDHRTNKNEDGNKINAQDNGNCETNKDKKANELGQKNNQTPVNVKANSIYGGAVGNDRVTNIVISNSNGQANKTIQSCLDGIHNKNSTSGNPMNSLDVIGNDDKDKNSETTISTILNENSSTTTSDQTEPSKITYTTMKDLAVKDKDNENSDGIAIDTSTTESSTINSEDTNDNETESTTAEDKSIKTSEDITIASTSNYISVATTVNLNDDIAENVSNTSNSTVVSTSSSTETPSVKCCNSTIDTTTFKSDLKEGETEEYDCATRDPTELVKLEITIGDNNKDKNNDRKCIQKQKKPKAGLLEKLGETLKEPQKGLLNI